MNDRLNVILTMDCEPALFECSPLTIELSGSGPATHEAGERSIRGYVEAADREGYPVTLFAHPEVAVAQPGVSLELQDAGACLGMHLHPYKFDDDRYPRDLGSFTAEQQTELVAAASKVWSDALGQHPRFFRGGVFSANDATFGVLVELGFEGGSLSCPGRILPEATAIWAGAELYPHRANLSFRHIEGDSDFVEVPISSDTSRPMERGDRREIGLEWPYVPSRLYDHAEVARSVISRGIDDGAAFPTYVTNTHQDQDYADPEHPASVNLQTIFQTLRESSSELGIGLSGATIADMCDKVRDADLYATPGATLSQAPADLTTTA
jgi:peptidoglycan/xylan/chitin deacetylase (PgdA/CDA1 family)